MPSDREIVEKVYNFAREVRAKNATIASLIEKAVPDLLENSFGSPLENANSEYLCRFKGITNKTAPYIERVIKGESNDAIIIDVPRVAPRMPARSRDYVEKDKGDFDGSWDNAVRTTEGN